MWFSKKTNPEKLLQEALLNKSADGVQQALASIYTSKTIPKDISYILIMLLREAWHFSHEDIAMALKEIKDLSSVNELYLTTEQKFDYLAYDDTFQLARKCIKAISAIDNENAIEKLKLLSQSNNGVIKAYAEKELNYKISNKSK
jgi:DNA-binding transcriptional regulator GbsR (MarR family)